MSLIIPTDTFSLECGELKTFETQTDSSRTKICAFCPNCGVRIYNQSSTLRSIKAGTLDDTTWLTPNAHYWTKHKQLWSQLPQEVACYDQNE